MFDTTSVETNEPLHKNIEPKKAQVCPVCHGSKAVPFNFYKDKFDVPQDMATQYETCRSCVNGLVRS